MFEQRALIAGINQIALASADPPKLADFYRRALGLTVLFETAGMIFFATGAARLMIGPKRPDQPIGGDAVVYFEPSDWSAAEAKIEDAGVAFLHGASVLMREPGRELALRPFKDPEGHNLALLGWRPA